MKQCKDCEERHLGCHSDCPDYAEFRAEVERKNELRRLYWEAEAFGKRSWRNKRKVKK